MKRFVLDGNSVYLLICLGCFFLRIADTSPVPIRVPLGVTLHDPTKLINRTFEFAVVYVNNGIIDPSIRLHAVVDHVNMENGFKMTRSLCRVLQKGVFAMFGDSYESSFNILQSYAQAFHMPYIFVSPTRSTATDDYEFEINMRPSYIDAIADIIKTYRWEKVYFVFDSDDALWHLQKLYTTFQDPKYNLTIDVRRLDKIYNSYDILRKLDRTNLQGQKRIILDLSETKHYKTVLEQIMDLGMNRDNYHYVLGGLCVRDLDLKKFIHGGVTITGFQLIDYEGETMKRFIKEWEAWIGFRTNRTNHYSHRNIFFKMEAALTVDSVHAISGALNKLYRNSTSRKVFKSFRHGNGTLYNNKTRGIDCASEPPTPWVNGNAILNALKQVDFEGITGRVSFDKNGFRKDYKLDVYQLSHNTQLTHIGNWTKSRSFESDYIRPSPPTEEPGIKTIIVTTILASPFLEKIQSDEELTGNDRYRGYCKDLADELFARLGLEYRLVPSADGQYGRLNKSTGRWDGMVGELLDGNADVAVAPLTITQERENVTDFSKPFMDTAISIMIKKPEKQKPHIFSFKEPLDNDVWLCITFGFLSVSFILYLVGRFSPYEWQKGERSGQEVIINPFSAQNALWFAIGSLLQQGSDVMPRSLSGRLLGSIWWFFILIMISSYTANLAAFLTIERMTFTIKSADDLAKQTKIGYGTLEHGSTREFFKQSEVRTYSLMSAYMESHPENFVDSTSEGVERVQRPKEEYAFLLESPMNDYYNQRKPCKTMRIGNDLNKKGYGIATPRGSQLRKKINLTVLKLKELGFLHKLYVQWWFHKGECGAASGSDSKTNSLTLSNVAGVFHIVIGGLILSMLVAALDFLYTAKLKKRQLQFYNSPS